MARMLTILMPRFDAFSRYFAIDLIIRDALISRRDARVCPRHACRLQRVVRTTYVIRRHAATPPHRRDASRFRCSRMPFMPRVPARLLL